VLRRAAALLARTPAGGLALEALFAPRDLRTPLFAPDIFFAIALSRKAVNCREVYYAAAPPESGATAPRLY
jgi:hypothetical protein